MKTLAKFKVVHEDVKMKMFKIYLPLFKDNVKSWYVGLPNKRNHFLKEFINILCERWHHYFKGDVGYLIDRDNYFPSLEDEDSDEDQPLERSHEEAIVEEPLVEDFFKEIEELHDEDQEKELEEETYLKEEHVQEEILEVFQPFMHA